MPEHVCKAGNRTLCIIIIIIIIIRPKQMSITLHSISLDPRRVNSLVTIQSKSLRLLHNCIASIYTATCPSIHTTTNNSWEGMSPHCIGSPTSSPHLNSALDDNFYRALHFSYLCTQSNISTLYL